MTTISSSIPIPPSSHNIMDSLSPSDFCELEVGESSSYIEQIYTPPSPVEFLSKWQQLLGVIGSLSAGDFLLVDSEKMTVTKVSKCFNINKLLYSQPAIDETNYNLSANLQQLTHLLNKGEKQINLLVQEKGKKYHLERVLLAIKDALLNAEKGIGVLRDTSKSLGLEVQEGMFTPLERFINHTLIPTLPKEPNTTIGVEKGFWEQVSDLIYESELEEDIDWKISRYKSALKQLKDAVLERENPLLPEIEKAVLFEDLTKEGSAVHSLTSLFELLDLESTEMTREYLNTLRQGHRDVIIFLRKILSFTVDESGQIKEGMDLFDAFACRVAEVIFTQISLAKESAELVAKFNQLGRQHSEIDSQTMEKSVIELIKPTHDHIKQVPSGPRAPLTSRAFNGLRKHWNFDYDPALQSNMSEYKGLLSYTGSNGEKKIKLLAFGTPTYEGKVEYAQVTPEFLAWMRSYKQQGKSHLFVIHQDMRRTMTTFPFGEVLERMRGGFEHDRISAILNVGEKGEYVGTLYCIVYSKNSPFYYQTEEFKEQDDASIFKEELLNQHFDVPSEVSGNYYSSQVIQKVPDLKELSRTLCESIHQKFFEGKASLTREERQIFIEAFQDESIRILMVKLENDSLSFGCKDTADRSADTIARFVGKLCISQGKHRLPGFLPLIETLLYSRALMVCKRPIIEHRVDRTIPHLNFMYKNEEALIALQKNGPLPYDIDPSFEGLE